MNRRLVICGALSLVAYLGLVALGDLRSQLPWYLAVHAALFLLYASLLVEIGIGVRGDRGFVAETPAPGGRKVPASAVGRRRPMGVPAAAAGQAGTARAGIGAAGVPGPDPAPFGEAREEGESPHDGLDAREVEQTAFPATLRTAWRRLFPRSERAWAVMVLFAALFRAALVLAPPSLSDDLYRYLWDGRVQAAGIDPYRHSPDAPELETLRDSEWARINHREIPTIYPPAAEMVFLALSRLGLGAAGFKAIFCLFDLGTVLALGMVLRALGRSPLYAAVYAWNPLVIVEVASSGHSDPLGLAVLVVSAGLMIGKRRALSIALYALSILARVLPLAFVPIYVRRFRFRHLVLGAAIVLVGVALYARSGIGLLSGLRAYAENWDYNSVLFPALRGVLERSVDVEALKSGVTWFKDAIGDPAWCQALYSYVYPAPLARALSALAMVAGAFAIALREARIERALFLATALLLVLTPTLHPWYVLWILPFAALEASVPWILFSALAPLSYLSLREPDGRVPGAVLAVEWGLPALAALTIAVWRRTRRRDR